mmetsp:Transcript_38477/g.90827  ORF Transcript_38477/g.90827 Transcript_38477/m.90827 type:complete len:269 (+) Transcript_38477:813-1619(+)
MEVRKRAVRPSSSTASRLAPFDTSCFTIASAAFSSFSAPVAAAIISAVCPFSLARFTSAYHRTRRSTPFCDAMAAASCSAVPWALLTWLGSAFAFSSACRTSSLPPAAATMRASKPFSSWMLTSAFFLIMSPTTSAHPSPEASMRAVPPFLWTTVTSAPFLSSSWAASFWLEAHAMMRDVSPLSPTALMSALAASRVSIALVCPALAATMRGVQPSFPGTSTSRPRSRSFWRRSAQPSPANSVSRDPPSLWRTSMSAPFSSRKSTISR